MIKVIKMKMFLSLQILISITIQVYGLYDNLNIEMIAIGNLTTLSAVCMYSFIENPNLTDGKAFPCLNSEKKKNKSE